MNDRYKLIISNRNLYKEIELSDDIQRIKIGTSQDCDVRLRRELFFSTIELSLNNNNGEWSLMCSDNLYLTVGDMRKLFTKKLEHGDELVAKYQESDNDVFEISFMVDFEYENKDYNLEIDISGDRKIKIGGSQDCDICFDDYYLGKDSLLLDKINDTVKITDLSSKYGVYVNGIKIDKSTELHDKDFFSIVGKSFYYMNDKLYTDSEYKVKINNLPTKDILIQSTHFKYPKFVRNTRVQYVISEDELEIQQPSQCPKKPEKSLAMALIPSVVMLAMTIVLRGIMGGGGMFVIYSAVSMSMGIIMSIVTYFKDNKTYKKDYENRIKEYNEYIDKKKSLISESRKKELSVRKLIYESIDESIKEVDNFGKRIFEKNPGDKDFLHIYLGYGKIESANPVKFNKQEFIDTNDPLAELPEKTSEEYRYIEDAPIISDFRNSNGVGIVGELELLENMLKNITLDICIRHFYDDVKFVYILNDEYIAKMGWIRWLHNVENEKLDIRNIVCDDESRNCVLEDLYTVLSEREMTAGENKEITYDEQYVVFVTDSSLISTHPISKYIKESAKYGFTFVFFEKYEEFIPQGCTELIRLENNTEGTIIKTENGDASLRFKYPEITYDKAESVSKYLGAVTVDSVSLEGELTKNISMYEMLGILSVEDINLEERWESSKVYKSLAAPIGVKKKNEIVCLDIGDKGKAHGPHGLVAGTTGSGKSEVLQTYILSMATLYHPYEVGFVIIDFKGGGMANQFKDLPHLIGTITNIDGREINRSLMSIKAELVKRQEMFSEAGVNHINDYIKLYKSNKVNVPMPHLIMIVDEFAELKQEYPDFMKELISAARIGRTLGVHLILATQKPAGVVDAQIWSNSKFKLCLKVQTKEDSNEVIKTPLAAEIVEPGRAYFQVGNNEIFELFQSAYSGAGVPEGNENNEKIYGIYEKNLWGKKSLVYTNKKSKSSNNKVSQLQAIVNYIDTYCKSHLIERLPGICLPSLQDRLTTNSLEYNTESIGITVPIGIYDDPEQQKQDVLNLNISRDNTYIVGSSQTGKTVLLQTLIYGLINKYTPEDVNIYIIDCGSMVLKLFENSAHVGGVVTPSDEEKCRNLFKLLKQITVERKKKISDRGVGNYAAYLEAGYKDLPLCAVVIDNMAAFKEYFPDESEEISSLTREAQGVGISFIITAVISNALNYKTQANFASKLVLNCNDPNEYGAVFGHCKTTPKENPGRGLCMLDKRILEFQTAIYGECTKESERSELLVEYLKSRNGEFTSRAKQIPMIPEHLSLNECMENNPELFRKIETLPIGMEFSRVDYLSMNIAENNSLSLLGNTESKEIFMRNMLHMIAETAVFHNIEAYVIDCKSKALGECERYGFVQEYVYDTADGYTTLMDLCDEIDDRKDEGDNDTCLMVVLNNAEVFNKVCSDRTDSKQLADAIKSATQANAFIVFANVENQTVSFSASDILKTLKEERHAILFDQLTESKMYDVSGRVREEANFDNTMGYYFNKNTYSKIKIYD